MCGRFTLDIDILTLMGRYGMAYVDPQWTPNSNIRPTTPILAIADLINMRAELYRWGLVPFWAKDTNASYSTFNARSEGIETKPAFRDAFKHRRCLIPASGYYEWRDEGGRKKQPYLFKVADQNLFYFAGLWESYQTATNDEVRSCTIITCAPNALAGQYHDRMPVILPGEAADIWMADETPAVLQSVLRPLPVEAMAEPKPVTL